MNRIEFGDCRDTMRAWAAQGIKAQMCVTSPPYFGLRDYGHAGQLGLEQTPEQYVGAMVEVFRCVWDVLADDGTLWLNIGDSYAGSWGAQGHGSSPSSAMARGQILAHPNKVHNTGTIRAAGVKPKDLYGIPWMLAFALRADGWYLRQEIIWNKPNPMPESISDRCTKSHESLFLLSKQQSYYFDQDAIREPAAPASIARWAQNIDKQAGSNRVPGKTNGTMKAVGGSRRNSFARQTATTPPPGTPTQHRPDREDVHYGGATRNRRSVWTVATRPYKGAHFATFPPALIEPCIRAGSRVGDIVLDPFMGSGTTAAVALGLERQYLGCELNLDYRPLQDARIAAVPPQLNLLRA